MTSTEIEDILSSIRRLVSEEDRPPLRGSAAKGEKLVLTPALRIVPPDAPLALTDPIAPPVADVPDRPVDDIPVPPPQAEHNVAPAALTTEDVPDLPAVETPESGMSAEPLPDAHFPPMADDAPSDTTDLEPQPPLGPPASHEAAAVLEVALARAPGDWEPDGGEPARSASWTADWDADAAEDEGETRAETAPPAEGSQDGAAAEPPEDTDFDRVWEDFLAEATPADPSPPAAFAEAEAEAEGDGLAWHVAPDPAADDVEPPEQDRTVIDEDMLRDIVRDVLREELQGQLGERITRNVRKLVRAEIYRAMTARDLG